MDALQHHNIACGMASSHHYLTGHYERSSPSLKKYSLLYQRALSQTQHFDCLFALISPSNNYYPHFIASFLSYLPRAPKSCFCFPLLTASSQCATVILTRRRPFGWPRGYTMR